METALEKHIMQIFKSPCKKPVRDHGAKVRFSGTTAAEAIPQPFFMVRRISAWKSSKTTFFTLFWKFQNNGMKWLTRYLNDATSLTIQRRIASRDAFTKGCPYCAGKRVLREKRSITWRSSRWIWSRKRTWPVWSYRAFLEACYLDQVMINPNYIIQVGSVFGFIISIENIL